MDAIKIESLHEVLNSKYKYYNDTIYSEAIVLKWDDVMLEAKRTDVKNDIISLLRQLLLIEEE